MEAQTVGKCRICGNSELLAIINLGPQALSGVFPRSPEEADVVAPLELIKCSPAGCGLVQLRHNAKLEHMYGERYGYRSSIRPFMIAHLKEKAKKAVSLVDLVSGDLVLDIGSNDATLLRAYEVEGLRLVGIDPSAEKFREFYPANSELIVDFFSAEAVRAQVGDRSVQVITSIACFYDLPDPVQVMREVASILDTDGVWIVEHSYLVSMLNENCYDNICHEHLEFYALTQIEYMASLAGLKVVDAEITNVYGGSLCTTLVKIESDRPVDESSLLKIRELELRANLHTMAPFHAFADRIERHREQLCSFLDASAREGKQTLGYGASTKGNVLLQYCGLTGRELPCIGEVNEEKHGCFTPGTRIPIVSEDTAKAECPDQLLVLPWIYRNGFIEREQEFLNTGGKLVFPLPELSVI